MVEANGVIAGVVRDAQVKSADPIIQTLKDGSVLTAVNLGGENTVV